MVIEEDKIKIAWYPAPIERWLLRGKDLKETSSKANPIVIDSYVVTIFPAESVTTTQTLPALLKDDGHEDEALYSAWFNDLQGGKTEYVITISCQIA